MSSSSNYHKQQQAARHPRANIAHGAAAALYDEMSHAASRTSRSTSPELRRTSPSPPMRHGHGHGEHVFAASPLSNPALSTPPPGMTTTTTTTTNTRTANTAAAAYSNASSPSNSVGASSAHPFFYLRPLSSTAGARGIGQAGVVGGGGGLTHHHTVTGNVSTSPSIAAELENGNVNVGRGTLVSITAATPLQPAAAAGSVLCNNSASPLATPPSSLRVGSLPSVPPTTLTGVGAASSTAPVYIRHTPASMSATAPWLRLHRFSGNAGSSAVITGTTSGSVAGAGVIGGSSISSSSVAGMGPGSPGLPNAGNARKASGTAGGVLTGTSIAAATVVGTAATAAGVSGMGTPRVGSTAINASTPAVPGTPRASLDLAHGAGSEDEAALTCQLCQSLNCVCGRGGGTGEGGFTDIGAYSGGSGGGGALWSAALALHQQQQLLHLPTASQAAAAVGSFVPLSLVPPFRIARVESGVYRGAYPVLRNFPYLRRLRLRSIVSLIPEPPTYDLKCFAEAEHIQLHHIHAERAKGEVQLLPSELSEALQLIMNADLHPLYVHCLDGRHVTGLVIMGVRKLQQWDIKASHVEYLRFTREEQDEVSFIADYTGPLLVPPHIPSWLWGGSLYDPATGQPKKLQPSTMRLRLSTTVTVTGSATSHASSSDGAGFPSTAGGPNGPAGTATTTTSAAGDGYQQGSSGLLPMRTNSTALASAGGGDARLRATAPWMSVPNAELVASDGQLYVDVGRVQGASALYSGSTSDASYNNIPILFSFEYAAAVRGAATPSAGGGTGGTPGHSRTRRSSKTGGAPTSASANDGSRHSSQSSSANASIAGPPGGGSAASAPAGPRNSAGNTRSTSPSAKWLMTAPLDVLQPLRSPYHMQPPSPNGSGAPTATPGAAGTTASTQRSSPVPSNGSNNTNDGGTTTTSSSFFDNQLSALMWTSGLTTPPTGPALRKAAGGSTCAAGTVGTSSAKPGGAGGGSSGSSGAEGGTATGNVGGGGGGGNGGAVGGTAVAALGGRRAAGAVVSAASTNMSSRAAKRSYSR
jgi:tyrosine-protein phosphatase OCA6